VKEQHNFNAGRTIAGKPYCVNCGLVLLRNLLTDWCARRGCGYADDPGYSNALATLPARHRGEA
jgi:hypothetical protein